MTSPFHAVKALVGDVLPVHDTDATGFTPSYPYLLVISTIDDDADQDTLSGETFEDDVTIKAVGITADHVRLVARRARALVDKKTVEIDGTYFTLKFEYSRSILSERTSNTDTTDRQVFWADLVFSCHIENRKGVKN